jgi:hypothetical protein
VTLLIVLGLAAGLLGAMVFVGAVRGRRDPQGARPAAMLIAGMMLTAFGLLLVGLAVGYESSAPLAEGVGQ